MRTLIAKLINKIVQLILDVIVGFAGYYLLDQFTQLTGNIKILIALLICAFFAEIFEVIVKE